MVKNRNIILCLIFTFITCGIYGIYWYVCLANDTNTVSGVQDTSGGLVLLLTIITCGIYGLYWAFKCGEKIDTAKRNRGMAASNGGILYLLLYLLGGIIAFALIQHEINRLA
ncbi:MAG: putative rane protein [Herbinix sp.]|jgi:amino acid transporter|nr:putative rane protein [Herbinix sp.]